MDYDQEFFEMFDLSPQAFPWADTRRDAVIRRREEEMDGELFFDALLRLAGIDAHAVYPPRDVPSFHHLVNAILDTAWDDFQQSCLIYYLLRHWEDGREKPFAQSKMLPPQFMFVSDAYYLLDADRSEEAVPFLCDHRVLHEFTSKIMKTLASIHEPTVASKSLLRFVRVAKPTLSKEEDLDLYVNALCYSSITDAWLYQRSLPENTPDRERHISRIIMFCFYPKPRPEPLKTLLGFPFTAYEDRMVKSMALSPPDILSDASVAIFQNMISVRLIHSGHYSEAIQLDRQFANAGTYTGPAVKDAAARRKETLEELMGVIPDVQRRVLEMEIEEQEAEARKGKGPLIHGYANGQTQSNGDLAMSWEHVNGSASMVLDSPPRNASAQPSTSSMTPLTASAAFRQAGSNAAVLKAFVHTSRLEGSPYLSARSGSSTPIAPINFGNASTNSPFARSFSSQRAGSQATGSPAPLRGPRASFGSYPVRSAASTPTGSSLAVPPPAPANASRPTTRPAFNIQPPNSSNKTPSTRNAYVAPSPASNTATPKPFTNPLSSATAGGSGSAGPERRVTPVKRPFGSSGGPGDRSMSSINASWSNIPAPERADEEMDYDDGLDEDFVVQPAHSRPRYNPPEEESEQEQEPEHEEEHEEHEEEHDEEPEPEPEPTPEPEPDPAPVRRTRRQKDAPALPTRTSDARLPGAFPSSPHMTRATLPHADESDLESPKKPSTRRTTRGRVSRASSVAMTDDGEDEPRPRRSTRLSHMSETSPPPSPPRATAKSTMRKSKTGASKVKTRRQREVIPEEA